MHIMVWLFATMSVGALAVGAVPDGGGLCETDWNCSLAGQCINHSCECDPWATGEQCGLLNLVTPVDPANQGLQVPGYYSWGGHAAWDPATNLYQGFFSFMCHHQTLSGWTKVSSIVRATSTQPEGPYTVAKMLIQPWAHNTMLVYDPPSKSHVLFFIGTAVANRSLWAPCYQAPNGTALAFEDNSDVADKARHAAAATSAATATAVATSMTEHDPTASRPALPSTSKRQQPHQQRLDDPTHRPFDPNPNPNLHSHVDNITGPGNPKPGDVSAATSNDGSLTGDWTMFDGWLPSPSPGNNPNINFTQDWMGGRVGGNPAPFIFDNGTTLLYFSAQPCPANWGRSNTCIAVAKADTWKGPYTTVGTLPVTRPESEDPFVFRDQRGHFHLLTNINNGHQRCSQGVACGGHAWSYDGITFSDLDIGAYGPAIPLRNGTVWQNAYIERPQVLQDADGTPIAFFTGMGRSSYLDSCSWVQRFCTTKGDPTCQPTGKLCHWKNVTDGANTVFCNGTAY
eukprot:m.64003 g.64003  ORF g.64003 m.64003 type:complete len:512 (-) comp8194_c0_seq1:645-2180(-)